MNYAWHVAKFVLFYFLGPQLWEIGWTLPQCKQNGRKRTRKLVTSSLGKKEDTIRALCSKFELNLWKIVSLPKLF